MSDARPGPVAAVLVDWNGTMVDDAERALSATGTALRSIGHDHGAPTSVAAFRARFVLPMEAYFAGLGVGPGDLDAGIQAWNTAMAGLPAALAPGARALLERAAAARVPVVVVSGAQERVVRQDCALLGIDALIAGVHGSVHPKRDVLQSYAARGRIVYVGDTPYDVAEGRAAGATTVAVDFGYGAVCELGDADLVVSDLQDVAALL